MYSIGRVAVLLASIFTALQVLQAQDSGLSTAPAPQSQAPQLKPAENQGQMSVQARIRARRSQRRAQAIRDTYSHLFDGFMGGGYLRFKPGPKLQRVTLYSWNAEVTRYYSQKLGVTIDGRGYYGTAFVGLNPFGLTRPAISQYGVLGGPTYRFVLHPRYSLSAHALGGVALGNFSGDTNGFNPQALGLYKDSTTYAVSGGAVGEVNVSPNLSLRLTGDYYGTGFGSEMQNSVGFSYGFVYRFGRQ